MDATVINSDDNKPRERRDAPPVATVVVEAESDTAAALAEASVTTPVGLLAVGLVVVYVPSPEELTARDPKPTWTLSKSNTV